MERVQFQQEQMLAELKDLVQKGLFTQKEVKQIMQKRTMFETALVRRIPKKSDFLRYAAYEMGLEALRRRRVERMEMAKAPPSISDYALVRRQFQIFERALKKFKGDVGLWLQYIQVAKKEGARALVGRITARALQLHPNVPALYVLAASHELEHLSPSAARALLQRGLRLNADNVEMWREYVRMELGFVESLRRRWSVLGIDVKGKGKHRGASKGKGKEKEADAEDPYSGLGEGDGGEEADHMDVDGEDIDVDEAARKEVMAGAIVKSVISSAAKAIPKIELFTSLHELISAYPSPPSLRESLLDHLHALLHQTLPSDPAAIKLSATRHLKADLVGEPLVDALKDANEQLLAYIRSTGGPVSPPVAAVYADFVEEWCGKDVDDTLKAYLITSLHILIRQLPAPVPPGLLAAHIRLLSSHHASLGSGLLPAKANSPEKILRIARKHTTRAPSSTAVWLARLGAERQFATQDEIETAWGEARKHATGDRVQDVWLWGLEPANRLPSSPSGAPNASSETEDADIQADVELLEQLLHESSLIREPAAASALHEVLLIRYAAASHRALLHRFRITSAPATIAQAPPRRHVGQQRHIANVRGDLSASAEARLARVRKIGSAYAPSARVWAEVFRQEAGGDSDVATTASTSAGGADSPRSSFGDADGDERVIRAVYEFWRQTDGAEATVAWATWLLRSGRSKDAVAVVARARSVLGEAAGEAVERRWKSVLDGPEDGTMNSEEVPSAAWFDDAAAEETFAL
ncbi:U3 small nucleolar RNA-associated protein 6-domain-containing protein [Cerioporus squamosus]|nr:U3 small nucleolar RNA-associated protein 6-domain-containing protein [Cerioporus squamosus]